MARSTATIERPFCASEPASNAASACTAQIHPTADIAQPAVAPSAASKPYKWILHPVLDILFCCGGIVWIFFALQYFLFQPLSLSKPLEIMLALSGLGAIGLSETHVVSTLARIYKTSDQRQKFAPYAYWAALACIVLAITGCFFQQLIPVLLKLYLLFVAQHFTAQTFGLTMLYCAKSGYVLKKWDRQILAWLMQSTMSVAVLRQLTWHEWSGDVLLGYKLPFWGPLPAWVCHLAELSVCMCAVALLCLVVIKWRQEGTLPPLPAALMTITGVLVFLIGKDMGGCLWLYVPAFFHASQYIAVSLAFYLKEKGLPEGIAANEIATQISEPAAAHYMLLLLICALCFFQGLPWLFGLIGFKAAAVAASTFAAIHFHHFLTDRAIWKLRDPEIRKLLVA